MAKLYFSYAAMNAGKSTSLLQVAHNYGERKMDTHLLTAALDNRVGQLGKITSRVGIEKEAQIFVGDTDLLKTLCEVKNDKQISAVLIDEAQWLTQKQVWELAEFVDTEKVPVMCYGLRTDFQGKLFPGSEALLAIADELREIRTICHCGRKATMTVRYDVDGSPVKKGSQNLVGGNESYESMCRNHWLETLGRLSSGS